MLKLKTQNLKSKGGFTLVELIITIALTAALSLTGIAVFLNARSRQNLTLTAQEIVSVLREAQLRSISQASSTNWGVHFENSATTTDFFASFAGASYSTAARNAVYPLRNSVEFSDPSSGASKDIVFAKVTGTTTASTAVKISLTGNSSVSTTITVEAGGRITY